MKKQSWHKKLTSIALLLVLVIGLSACSAGGSSSGSGASSSAASGTNAPAAAATHSLTDIVKADAKWEQVAQVTDGVFIEGINFDKNGTLWFLDVAGFRVYRVVDGKVEVVFEDPQKAMPNGGKFINDTTLLIVDRLQGICTFNIETLEYKVVASDFNGVPFLGLNDIALDGKGNAYITDAGNASTTNPISKVYKMNLADFSLQLFESGVAFANGITVGSDGFVYIAEFDRNQLLQAPVAAGKETTRVFTRLSGGIGPDGIAADAKGNIYAAHLGMGEIVVMASDGLEYGAIRLPEGSGKMTTNLAFHNGYMYVTEAGQSIIWRIAVNSEPAIG